MAVVVGTSAGFVTSEPTSAPTGSQAGHDTYAVAFKVVAPAGGGSISKMGWYVNNATEAANFKLGIYSHDSANDRPNALLASSADTAKGTTSGWKSADVDFDFTGETTYWFCIQCDDTATMTIGIYTADATQKIDYKASQTDLPSPWGTSDGTAGRISAIYALYTQDASGESFIGSGEVLLAGFSNNLLTMNYYGVGVGEIIGNAENILSLINSGNGSLLFGGESFSSYSGLSSYVFSGSGLFITDGKSSELLELNINGNGKIDIIGNSNNLFGLANIGYGNILLNGNSTSLESFNNIGLGEIIFNGSSQTSYGVSDYQFIGSGEIIFSGTGLSFSIVGLMTIDFIGKNPTILFTIKKQTISFNIKNPSITFIGNNGE
jgi:hypothetical protein